jgi:polyhydroxybutyrate depolymerase
MEICRLLRLCVLSCAAFGASSHAVLAAGGRETLLHGGLQREYELHAPPSVSGKAPLIVVLHGGGIQENPVGMIKALTRFDTKADEVGAFVLYPFAVENHWNDGRGLDRYRSHAKGVDDVGFLEALVDHVAARAPIDTGRVYITGASNGAMMSFRFACERPGRVAAIAAVAGNLPERLTCKPSRAVPTLVINGTDDPMMPWKGGEVRFGPQKLGKVLSTPETVERWAKAARCKQGPIEEALPDRSRIDGTRVFRGVWQGCQGGVEVALYRVEGGGHTWPGGPQQTGRAIVGRTSRDIDATDVIWSFFAAHGKRR